MIVTAQNQWKQLLEGLRRGDISPLTQINSSSGTNGIREYTDNGSVVARMTVFDSNTDKAGYLCTRQFEIDQSLIDATKYIYIPTDQDIEDWSEQELDIDAEIAAREPVV